MPNQISPRLLAAGLFFLGVPLSALAINFQQLTIEDGVYQSAGAQASDGESTLASASNFTLYALLKEGEPLADYFISAALWPRPDSEPTTAPDLGSIEINGNTILITEDMKWGTPTGLPTHDVFETYFAEISFAFDAANVIEEFNAADYTPTDPLVGDPSLDCDGKGSANVKCMYFQSFSVEVSNLNPNYSIHFDLYGNSKKAPFNHDAHSGPGRPGTTLPSGGIGSVPEPATLVLLGLGIAGIGYQRRKHAKAS
jgi:hypothetical protein